MQTESVLPALQKTIESLFSGLDKSAAYLDLFITHWPYSVDPACTVSPAPFEQRRGYSPDAYLSVWREMEAAVDAGLVRRLGCSNMTPKKLHALWAAARIQPVNVQVELHPCLAQPTLHAFCAARGIVLTGYSPLGSPGRPAAYRADGDPDVLRHPALVSVAARLDRTPAQVALRWAVQVSPPKIWARGSVPPRFFLCSRAAGYSPPAANNDARPGGGEPGRGPRTGIGRRKLEPLSGGYGCHCFRRCEPAGWPHHERRQLCEPGRAVGSGVGRRLGGAHCRRAECLVKRSRA